MGGLGRAGLVPGNGGSHDMHRSPCFASLIFRRFTFLQYVMSAQYCDASDLNNYLGPMIAATGVASFLGFVASSSLLADNLFLRSMVSLVSGFLAVMSTTIITLRNTTKFDVKVWPC